MKDELQYWKDVAARAVVGYYEQMRKIRSIDGTVDPESMAEADVEDACNIGSNEVTAILDGDESEAYEYYKEEHPPLHDYKVSFSFEGLAGWVHVKAKDEDEASEYVQSNMSVEFDGMPFYMADDDNVIDDIEQDYDSYDYNNCSIDYVEDFGEYEEDE